MIIEFATWIDVQRAAFDAGVEVRNFRWINKKSTRAAFTLGLSPDKRYQRRGRLVPPNSRTGRPRLIGAVCYHGHRRFFDALFRRNEAIRIQTRMTAGTADKWYTADNCERLYERCAEVNIGSQFEPLYFADACDCERDGDGDIAIVYLRNLPVSPKYGQHLYCGSCGSQWSAARGDYFDRSHLEAFTCGASVTAVDGTLVRCNAYLILRSR